MEVSATEVRLGTTANERTSNTAVRGFAEKVIADQNEVLYKLMDLRAARTVIRATPVTANNFIVQTGWGTERIHRSAGDIPMSPDHHRTFERLSSVPTEEFDRQFINEIIREHREAIAFFEEQTHVHGNEVLRTAPRAVQDYSSEELLKDVDTADFAAATLPTLRHRLREAEALQKHLQKR
jgi:predicted outer membrane protein